MNPIRRIRPGAKPKPHGKLKSRLVVFVENDKIEAMGGIEKAQEHLYSLMQ